MTLATPVSEPEAVVAGSAFVRKGRSFIFILRLCRQREPVASASGSDTAPRHKANYLAGAFLSMNSESSWARVVELS